MADICRRHHFRCGPKRKPLWTCYLYPKRHRHSLYTELRNYRKGGGGGDRHPLGPKRKKNGLDKVNEHTNYGERIKVSNHMPLNCQNAYVKFPVPFAKE